MTRRDDITERTGRGKKSRLRRYRHLHVHPIVCVLTHLTEVRGIWLELLPPVNFLKHDQSIEVPYPYLVPYTFPAEKQAGSNTLLCLRYPVRGRNLVVQRREASPSQHKRQVSQQRLFHHRGSCL